MDRSIQGERFGKLAVIGPPSEIKYGCRTVLCRCDSGKTTQVSVTNLTGGSVKSCGCLRQRALHDCKLS